jgi:hypothetical protein
MNYWEIYDPAIELFLQNEMPGFLNVYVKVGDNSWSSLEWKTRGYEDKTVLLIKECKSSFNTNITSCSNRDYKVVIIK